MFDLLRALFAPRAKYSLSLPLPAPDPEHQRNVAVATESSEQHDEPVAPQSLPLQSTATGVRFCVDEVTATTKPLALTTLRESLELRAGTAVLILPEESTPAICPEGFVTKQPAVDRHLFLHPLVEAVHLAFSQHRPLVLTPDCIWLTIVQGFAYHLQENAEALRDRVVRHEQKKTLCVEARSLSPESWPGLISQFSEQIRANSDAVLYETLLCNFSTTTPTIRTACEVALMDAYQRYFEYVVRCVCGIPSIALEGRAQDWQRIRERIEVLATFGLEWWTSRLAPIIDQFIATANGTADRSFWQAIYKPAPVYAAEIATGWITDLFPYVGKIPYRRRNFMLDTPRVDWLPSGAGDSRRPIGLPPIAMPGGLSRAPVKVNFQDRAPLEVELLGGFVGVSQSPEDLSLGPAISWAVVEKESRTQPKPPF